MQAKRCCVFVFTALSSISAFIHGACRGRHGRCTHLHAGLQRDDDCAMESRRVSGYRGHGCSSGGLLWSLSHRRDLGTFELRRYESYAVGQEYTPRSSEYSQDAKTHCKWVVGPENAPSLIHLIQTPRCYSRYNLYSTMKKSHHMLQHCPCRGQSTMHR